MNWIDSNGHSLKMGDFVDIDGIVHVIKLLKIGAKNRMVFRPLPDENVLVEYHFLTYKAAKKGKITKIINYREN